MIVLTIIFSIITKIFLGLLSHKLIEDKTIRSEDLNIECLIFGIGMSLLGIPLDVLIIYKGYEVLGLFLFLIYIALLWNITSRFHNLLISIVILLIFQFILLISWHHIFDNEIFLKKEERYDTISCYY